MINKNLEFWSILGLMWADVDELKMCRGVGA